MKNKVKKPFNWKKELLSWGVIFIIALAAAFIITQFIIMKTKVISGSMIPELEIGDHVIGNRLAYLFSEPERGDVIIFEYPKSYKELYAIDPELTYCMNTELGDTEPRYHDESDVYVKRIIGLPGEKIEIRSGRVYINDFIVPLNEPYLKNKPLGNFGPYYVPDDCYFCMGDNRNNSSDSRDWDNTVDDPDSPNYDPDRFRFVHKDKIYAKAWLKIIPELHWINHCNYENS